MGKLPVLGKFLGRVVGKRIRRFKKLTPVRAAVEVAKLLGTLLGYLIILSTLLYALTSYFLLPFIDWASSTAGRIVSSATVHSDSAQVSSFDPSADTGLVSPIHPEESDFENKPDVSDYSEDSASTFFEDTQTRAMSLNAIENVVASLKETKTFKSSPKSDQKKDNRVRVRVGDRILDVDCLLALKGMLSNGAGGKIDKKQLHGLAPTYAEERLIKGRQRLIEHLEKELKEHEHAERILDSLRGLAINETGEELAINPQTSRLTLKAQSLIKKQQQQIERLEKELKERPKKKERDESASETEKFESISDQDAFVQNHPIRAFIEAHKQQLKDHFQTFYRANIAFLPPKIMYLNQPQPVELLIDPKHSPAELKRQLRQLVDQSKLDTTLLQPIVADSIVTSDIVEAHLTGTGFNITTIGPESQILRKDTSTRWSWDVTPEQEYAHRLHLSISTKIRLGDDSEYLGLQTYERDIEVRVSLMKRMAQILEKYQGVLPFIFGTASLLSFYGWLRNWLAQKANRPVVSNRNGQTENPQPDPEATPQKKPRKRRSSTKKPPASEEDSA